MKKINFFLRSSLFTFCTVIIFAIPFQTLASDDQCATYDMSSSTFHIPCLNLDNSSHWLDLGIPNGAYVVTVDGLSSQALLGFEAEWDDLYLYSALASTPVNLGNNDGITLLPYQWNRNAYLTAEVVDDLKGWLRSNYEYALSEQKRFIIISHSWGTVLTYLALALESQGENPIISDLYITLSSPIGTQNVPVAADPTLTIIEKGITNFTNFWLSSILTSENCLNCQPNVRSAMNFWALGDFISGPLYSHLPMADNIPVHETILDVRSTDELLSTPYWHEYTSLSCRDYCLDPNDNMPLKNKIKDSILKFSSGFMLEDFGSNTTSNGTKCASWDYLSNTLHIPCFNFSGTTFWLDLGLTSTNPFLFELKSYGVNVTPPTSVDVDLPQQRPEY